MCSADLAFLVLLSTISVSSCTYDTESSPNQFPKTPVKSAVLAFEQALAEVHLSDDRDVLDKCRLYEVETSDEEQGVVDQLQLPKVKVSLSEMLFVIEQCKPFAVNKSEVEEAEHTTSTEEGSNGSTDAAVAKRPWTVWTGILPGTLWCGSGDIADGYEQLGTRRELDRCCRAHDYCPIKLKAFRAGWGLVNFSLYTKSHCDCDELFYNCLKETNTTISNILGNFYFNMMKVQCMKPQRTMVCAEKIVPLDGKSQCIRWKYASQTPKMSFVDPLKTY